MLIVERMNGQKINLAELGIKVYRFYPEAPSPKTKTTELEGVDGHLDLGTTYEGRILRAQLEIFAQDLDDFALLRNEVFRIFDSKEPFDLIYESEPRKKWINCKYISPFTITHVSPTKGKFDIEFKSTSPYSHSIGSLLDPFTFDSELWQFGMNIPFDDFKYRHNTAKFDIRNLGDKLINPRHDMLQIFFTGASSNLTIENKTTGDKWQYFGTSNAGDTITLDGVFSRKNGVSIFGATNHNLISLAQGKNEFEITGAIGEFEVSFDFRFMYL